MIWPPPGPGVTQIRQALSVWTEDQPDTHKVKILFLGIKYLNKTFTAGMKVGERAGFQC